MFRYAAIHSHFTVERYMSKARKLQRTRPGVFLPLYEEKMMRNVLVSMLSGFVWLLVPMTGTAETDVERITRLLKERFPTANLERVTTSPVAGVLEVTIEGGVIYVSADGRFVFNGTLIEIATGEDLTERVLSKRRLKVLSRVPEERMIIFEPKGDVKYTLTTFTDIDCPYCQRMHQDMDALNGYGIRVRYLLFPRAGVDSVSYEKAVSVWCSKDRQKELTLAKAGEVPKRRECDNPVREHMALANDLGLTGTPLSITENGAKIVGYASAKALLQQVEAATTHAAR